jgi:uncharacterized phiE125 gp8 family phage protein
MSLTVTTAPTVEPISVSDVKCNLGIEEHDDDAEIASRIEAVRDAAQGVLWSALLTQTLTLKIDRGFPSCIVLPRAPLQSVTSVAYVDQNGDSQTLAADQYTVDSSSRPGRIVPAYNVTWPVTRYVIQAVTVVFVAGYGSTRSTVPAEVRRALIATASNMDCECGSPMREMLAHLLRGSEYDYSMARHAAEFV